MASAFQTTSSVLFSRKHVPRSADGSSSNNNNNNVNLKHPLPENELTPFVLAVSSGGDGDDTNVIHDSDDLVEQVVKGRGILCFVALLYGTLNVSLRLVYQLDAPPSAAALSAARGWLASLCFIPLVALRKVKTTPKKIDVLPSAESVESSSNKSPLIIAGAELAVWNFLAQGLLNVGLLSTGSARASFLTQTSVVMTPVISLLAGQSIAPTVWFGCAVALGGLTLLSGGASGGSMFAFSTGDLLVMGGALSWSLYLFRLSKIGSKFDEINLQGIKTLILAAFYSVWLAISLWQNPGGSTWGWVTNVTAWLALFYSAVAPGTAADILQQQGQKDVSASEANVILSMEPVFAALCARLLLGETTSLEETLGGGLILAAALIATR